MDEIAEAIGDYDALIYTKNDCTNCDSTKELMDELEISYTVVNIDKVPEARLAVKRMGFRQAPVVITKTAKWSGHQEAEIRSLKPRDLSEDDDIWN